MKKIFIFSFLILILCPLSCRAMPPGSIVYRTSGEGKMYGYSGDPLIYTEKGIVKNIYSGHAGIYIGAENGIDYVVEALSSGIVKTPANQFVNLAEGEKYLGAKIPTNLTAIQQAKVVALAKSLVGKNLAYDFDFKKQKGPNSGEWTCVGLTEKLYESANISNPNNLAAIEYNSNFYAINITPDGYDNYSLANDKGDCFSQDLEFSKIARRSDMIIPAPELIGYDVGLEKNGERYIFVPYTQFLQASLSDVTTDISLASSFSGTAVRGPVNTPALVLRWSLINNPESTVNIIKDKAKNILLSLKSKIFGSGGASGSWDETELVLNDESSKTNTTTTDVKTGAVINKAVSIPKSESKEAVATKKTEIASKTATNKTSGTSLETVPAYVNINKATSTVTTSISKNSQTNPKTSASVDASTTLKIATVADKQVQNTTAPTVYYYPVSAPAINISTGNNIADNVASDDTPKIATINKIYSTEDNDWVELYNPGDYDFDLAEAGYRLERAKTAADPTLIFRVGNSDDGTFPGGTIIKAHGSYLIVKNTASDYYLAKADAIANRDDFSWPGSAYTLYLGTGAISSNIDADIVEAVGFGPNATYFQGSGPAPEINDYYVLIRVKGQADNKTDFNLIKADDPSIVWAAISEETENTNEDSSADDIASSSDDIVEVENDTASTTEDIANDTNTSDDYIAPILINKIYSSGLNDWVELYNPNDFVIDLAVANYRLEKTKTALDPVLIMRIGNILDGSYPSGTIIPAHGTYLIVRDDASDYYLTKADAIATRTEFSWFDSGYTLYLGSGAINTNADADISDLVGFGPDATYWQGAGPAATINNNYILRRTATSANNNLDFSLIPSDDPSIDWSLGDNENESSNLIYDLSKVDADLFSEPAGIVSDDLAYLWHFDDCGGSSTASILNEANLDVGDHWRAGKFRCGEEAGFEYDKISGSLNQEIDINNFSVSFWFKATLNYPRLSFTMANDEGDAINMTLENGLMQFSGLPNPDWRYYRDFPFDSDWRQATLVVNRNEGYWSLYINGEEVFHINSYQRLAPMNLLELAGDNGPYAIDELALWRRALSPEEIREMFEIEEPFSPLLYSEPQAAAKIQHFWDFNEGIGLLSADRVGNADLITAKDSWSALSLNNSASIINWGRSLNVSFAPIESPDLSLTFKWRSPDTYLGNRMRISLGNEKANNIFGLIPSQFSSGFNFNNHDGYFSFEQNAGIPNDTNWHDLALVYNSYRNQLNFYVDGALKRQFDYIWSPTRTYPNMMEVVSENGSSEIDDIGVWEGALSPAQIQEIFANN